jgi:Fe-S cluster assembly protein DRE2 N-terminus
MLDRIASNFVQLPSSYYTEAILALPSTEEWAGEVDADYNELGGVLGKVLLTMVPGGRIKVGQPGDQVLKEAILAGFLVERQGDQVFPVRFVALTQ